MNIRFLKIFFLLYMLIGVSSGCTSILDNTSNPTITSTPLPPMQGFGVEYRPELFISMKWGLNPDEMPPLIAYIRSSDLSCCGGNPSDILRSRQAFLTYIDQDFFYILTVKDSPSLPEITAPHKFDLLKFSLDGQMLNRYHLSNTDPFMYNYNIYNFVVKEENIYILEGLNNGYEYESRIRKIMLENSHGKEVWKVTYTKKLEVGEHYRDEIYLDKNDTLDSITDNGRVTRLNIKTGEWLPEQFLSEKPPYKIFLSPKEELYSGYDETLLACSLQTYQCVKRTNDGSKFGDLLGIDKNDYVYDIYDDRIRILAPDGEYLAKFLWPNVVVKSIEEIYFGFWDEPTGTLIVRRWGATGQSTKDMLLKIPTKQGEYSSIGLVQVNSEGYFVSDGINSFLYQYDMDGELMSSFSFKGEDSSETRYKASKVLFDLSSRTHNLKVDYEGRLYLTITDPEGFKVVRLDPMLPEEKEQ